MPNIRKLLKNYQGLIISISILLLSAGSIVFGIIPGVRKVISLRSRIGELEAYTSALKVKVSVLQTLDEESQKNILNNLISAVPPEKSLSSVFSTIDGLSAATGVAVVDFSLSSPGSIATESSKKQSTEEKKIGSNLLPFSLTIEGSYEQIRNFIHQAIHVRRFFKIRQFDVGFSRTGGLSAHLGMDAFYAPFPTTIGDITQKLELYTPQEEAMIDRVSSLPLLAQEIAVENAAPSPSGILPKDNPFAP